MKKYSFKHIFVTFVVVFGALVLLPRVVSAHEIYVLSSTEITKALGIAPFNMFQVLLENLTRFVFYAFLGILGVIFIFFISTIRFLEKKIDPFLERIRIYAPLIARVTVGLSFLAAAYYQATYGPELPIASTYGQFVGLATVVLIVIGILIIFGLFTRVAAFIALSMYSIAVYFHGIYMFTYINYFGEIMVLLFLGAHSFSLDKWMASKNLSFIPNKTTYLNRFWKKIYDFIAPRSFAILRVFFGMSLIYASAYAKIIYNNLALLTVYKYHLDTIFHQEAHFLVLGAAIIELLIGIFFILGIEIRFTALFLLSFLTASLFFFGEVVWPHIILIGIPIAFIFYGYDQYSLEGYLFSKKKYKPIL